MTEDFQITKSMVECYKIRHENGSYWANIILDYQENSGRIQIASDFGSWQYYWGACGKSFKGFLCSLNKEYVANKFNTDRYFDLRKTVDMYWQMALESRKIGQTNRKEHLDFYLELKTLREGPPPITEFRFFLRENCPLIMERFNNMPDLCYSIEPLFERFWNEIWPVFIGELKNEM